MYLYCMLLTEYTTGHQNYQIKILLSTTTCVYACTRISLLPTYFRAQIINFLNKLMGKSLANFNIYTQ